MSTNTRGMMRPPNCNDNEDAGHGPSSAGIVPRLRQHTPFRAPYWKNHQLGGVTETFEVDPDDKRYRPAAKTLFPTRPALSMSVRTKDPLHRDGPGRTDHQKSGRTSGREHPSLFTTSRSINRFEPCSRTKNDHLVKRRSRNTRPRTIGARCCPSLRSSR